MCGIVGVTRGGAGDFVFASEIKALAGKAGHIEEFPPGAVFREGRGIRRYRNLNAPAERILNPSAAR